MVRKRQGIYWHILVNWGYKVISLKLRGRMGLLGGSKVLFPGPMGWGLSQGDGLDYHWWGLVATQIYTRSQTG